LFIIGVLDIVDVMGSYSPKYLKYLRRCSVFYLQSILMAGVLKIQVEWALKINSSTSTPYPPYGPHPIDFRLSREY
jgi:hypothetical protein